jgi:pimeloyl-ACP methyl ester carboxylesterase
MRLVILMAVLSGLLASRAHSEAKGDRTILEKVEALLPKTAGRDGLRCVSVEEVQGGVEVICELTYPDLQGQAATGQAKIFLPGRLLDHPQEKFPLLHVAGYEFDRGGGEGRLAQGEIVSTPHGDPVNPVVRGENLDVAILHRVRALPFVDDAKVQILGGSAGGYMALLLAAETFPLSCCASDVPPVNLGYNMAYFTHNQALAAAQPEGQDHPNMPILNVVCPLADWSAAFYGPDFDSDAWLAASPLRRLDEITAPTLIVCSTADLLVPIDQFGAELVRPFDPAKFPAGFDTVFS